MKTATKQLCCELQNEGTIHSKHKSVFFEQSLMILMFLVQGQIQVKTTEEDTEEEEMQKETKKTTTSTRGKALPADKRAIGTQQSEHSSSICSYQCFPFVDKTLRI